MAQQIQIRRDTSTNWSSVNPTLAQGEFGLETDSGKLKIGNGTSAWNSLSYFGGAGALASLTDVSISSLASGQVILSNGSSQFLNLSLGSLVNQLVSFSSLGSLAVMNQLSYGSILNTPSLGSLAAMNQLSFTSLTNQPSLSSLAFQATLDYTSNQLTNKPSLGSLAEMNQLSFTSLTNQPSLSSLAYQSTVDYLTQITNKPSLGSLAVLNDYSYTSLLNLPSLGSLAVLNSLTKSDVGLGNVTNDAQLKIASNLSDLNNIETARGNLSLGSLAVLNTVSAQLPSTASVDILYSNGIVNSSTVSTDFLYANNLFASTISTGIINAIGGVFASTVSSHILRSSGMLVASTASIRIIRGSSGTWTGTLTSANLSGTNTGDQIMPFYGDGSDATVNLDGTGSTNTLPFVSYNASTQTYTQLRDIYADSFYLANGYTLLTSGYRIFALSGFTNDGTISNNGGNASGTTAGTGATGGFFRAGGNGAAGLGTGAVAGSGAVSPLPTLNTYIGNVGGRGASARSAITDRVANNVALASLTFPVLGGKQLIGNFFTYQNPLISPTVTTVAQPTYTVGGGAGSKSATGTAATSGAGGGGGGVVFIASPQMTSLGAIEAKGGNGGNAAGTGGIFGGGGGGQGGYVILHTATSWGFDGVTVPTVSGGLGGTSAGNANTLALGRSDATIYTSTATVQYLNIRPNQALNEGSYYLMAVHVSYNAGSTVGVNNFDIGGMGMSFTEVAQVAFGTIANPTRSLFLFRGYLLNPNDDQLQDRIFINFTNPVNTCRITLDEIQNTAQHEGNSPYVNFATNSSDSATTAVTNLGYTPTTNNTQYTVVATSVGSAFAGGTGVTLLTNVATDPRVVSGLALSRTSSSISWTTAAAYGAITVDLSQPTAQEGGRPGAGGRVIYFTS
jgi:hypothetical protein